MKMLVIDEEHWAIEPLFDRLRERGLQPVYASSCSDAILQFRREKFDWIIIDVMLPGGDDPEVFGEVLTFGGNYHFGLDLLRYFRTNDKDVNLVLYTISDDEEVRTAAKDYNAHYVSKINRDGMTPILTLLGQG